MLLLSTLVVFRLALAVADVDAEAPKSLPQFAAQLLSRYETQSRFAIVEQNFDALKPKVRAATEDAPSTLRRATQKLEDLFSRRVAALRKLTVSAEASAKLHRSYDEKTVSEVRCEKYQRLMNDSNVHFDTNSVVENSGVHVNVEAYQCDSRVMRDFDWTGSDFVERTMAENKKESSDISHQYVGTYSGLTRMFPRRKWAIEPAPITIDLFDPAFRPWFVNAESRPKDIVFLVDYSGSVKGPTMHLIKVTMMYILSTLSPNDYFFGVYFNSEFKPIVACRNHSFMPATTSNKKVFFEKLGEIEEKDQAHFSTALKFSLDVLHGNLDSNVSLFADHRSGGHKLLIIFTDGVDEWPHQTLEDEFRTRGNDLIRIFGFSMGYSSGQLPLQSFMACNTFGGSAVVDSIMDVKPQSRSFLDKLSRVQGKALARTTPTQRQPSWTQLYMEAQGLGPVVTLSLPILAGTDPSWSKQTMAGVAAIDVLIGELTSTLPVVSDQMYAFIVDNNGIIIYHPKLIIPKSEVHCVRRSACYDASQVRSKSGSGLRVQYGFSDERVYRLVGLIDSIPTIDLYELEGDGAEVQDLRRRITTMTCHDEPIIDGLRELHCAHLKNSPFTLVIVNDLSHQTLVHSEDVPQVAAFQSPLVGTYVSRRDICAWKLDRFPTVDRFSALASLSQDDCDDDLRLPRAMANSMRSWAESWPQSEKIFTNASCALVPIPPGFEAKYFINSFVHTRPLISFFYPTCSDQAMKVVGKKFDAERLSKDDLDKLQFTVGDKSVVGYKTIMDENGNRLAVVGTQWRSEFIDRLLAAWIQNHDDWKKCRKQDCLFVTREGYVVASSTSRNPSHLTNFDPQLFESLVKADVVSLRTWVDVQSECMARKVAPWSSAAPGAHSLLKHAVLSLGRLFQSTFWLQSYDWLTQFAYAQPSMSGGICRFQRIKPFERCSLRHHQFRLSLNLSRQLQLVGMSSCSRFANVHPVPGTSLTLVIADAACPQYKPRIVYRSDPQKLEGCDVMQSRHRRVPAWLGNWTTVEEEEMDDCYSSVATSTRSPFLVATFLFLLLR